MTFVNHPVLDPVVNLLHKQPQKIVQGVREKNKIYGKYLWRWNQESLGESVGMI